MTKHATIRSCSRRYGFHPRPLSLAAVVVTATLATAAPSGAPREHWKEALQGLRARPHTSRRPSRTAFVHGRPRRCT
jgi:hypothetical protein